ncbi:MAG: hypothetical protein WC381_11600 [Kiritimatiellia bacterium]|jgi:hypothetical protein
MKRLTTLTTILALLFAIIFPAIGSEEGPATVTEIQITAKTTVANFGIMFVAGKQKPDFSSLVSLQLTFGGKSYSVPADELQKMGRVDLSSCRISAEVGYPGKGIGPYVYCTMQSGDGKTRHRLVFSTTGFKERL